MVNLRSIVMLNFPTAETHGCIFHNVKINIVEHIFYPLLEAYLNYLSLSSILNKIGFSEIPNKIIFKFGPRKLDESEYHFLLFIKDSRDRETMKPSLDNWLLKSQKDYNGFIEN